MCVNIPTVQKPENKYDVFLSSDRTGQTLLSYALISNNFSNIYYIGQFFVNSKNLLSFETKESCNSYLRPDDDYGYKLTASGVRSLDYQGIPNKTYDQLINGKWTFSQAVDCTALHALWSDIGENYLTDNLYPVGTLIEFGGLAEITIAKKEANGVVADPTRAALIVGKESEESLSQYVCSIGKINILCDGDIKKGSKLYLSKKIYGKASSIENGKCIGIALRDSFRDRDGGIKVYATTRITF
jgi:hypothetical protein